MTNPPPIDLRTLPKSRKCARMDCRARFTAKRWWQLYCSARCRMLAHLDRQKGAAA
jgi:hypothetical protein